MNVMTRLLINMHSHDLIFCISLQIKLPLLSCFTSPKSLPPTMPKTNSQVITCKGNSLFLHILQIYEILYIFFISRRGGFELIWLFVLWNNVAGIVSWGKDEPLKVEEIQVEPPKSSEVRVKILYASVCHTDLLFANGFPIVSTPLHHHLYSLISYSFYL